MVMTTFVVITETTVEATLVSNTRTWTLVAVAVVPSVPSELFFAVRPESEGITEKGGVLGGVRAVPYVLAGKGM